MTAALRLGLLVCCALVAPCVSSDLSGFEPRAIPHTLHQVSSPFAALTDQQRALCQGCFDAHPTFRHTVWTDDDLDGLVSAAFPASYPAWQALRPPSRKVATAIYAVLYAKGGVFLDSGVDCAGGSVEGLVDSLSAGAYITVHPEALPLMMSTPGNDFWVGLIDDALVNASAGARFQRSAAGAYTALRGVPVGGAAERIAWWQPQGQASA